MGEFSPVQLDALEDALEDLELVGIPLEFEDDASVSGRLSEYRELLQFSREALPSVDVPPGVLDSVLATARDEAGLPAVGASVGTGVARDASSESKTPWWKRLSMWVPALAVGASAALVLVMVQGTLSDAEPAASTVATADAPEKTASKTGVLVERGDALQAAAEPLADPSEEDERFGLGASQSRGRLRGSAAVDRAGDDFETVLEEEAEEEAPPAVAPSAPPADPEPTDKVIYDEDKGAPPEPAKERNNAKPSKASPSRSSGKKQDVARPKPQPSAGPKSKKTKPASKAPGGGAAGGAVVPDPAEELSSADGSRRKGRCSSARTVYRALVDHGEAKIRARALAGLGLCALSDGDEKGADAYFSRARTADSGIGSFISRERDSNEQSSQQAL